MSGHTDSPPPMAEQLKALVAENERLRTAFHWIADLPEDDDYPDTLWGRFWKKHRELFPDEWNDETKQQGFLRVFLTDEQARLYHSSPTFKASTDAFLYGFAPNFFRGLAEQAKEVDDRIRVATEALANRPLWACEQDNPMHHNPCSCPACGGTGFVVAYDESGMSPCPVCNADSEK